MKPIILCGKEIKNMTFNQTLEQFDKYLKGESFKYKKYPYDSYDEAYVECQFALWRAYEVYDYKSNVPFMAYLKRCVSNKIYEDMRNKRKREDNEYSLNKSIVRGEDKGELLIEDTLEDNVNIESLIENRDILKRAFKGYTEREIEEILSKLGLIDINQKQLCEKYGTYRHKIQRRTKKNLDKLRVRIIEELNL